ncbi:MAG: hypothetical protein WC356_02420 [Candidatus Micrarchaeia archaeon]|jgi:tRNA G10  N-methylase Trm11
MGTERVSIIKSISFDQDEILQNIVALHTGPIQADVTFGSGCFYKKSLPRPELCFDLAPRKPGVIAADACRLPLKDGCLNSVMFDPPFMACTGPGASLKARFGEIVGTIQDLWNFYHAAMYEIRRVLKPGGYLVFKCQDGVLSGVNNFTHVKVANQAIAMGYIPKDIFILLATHRMRDPNHKRQVHARKYHSYFWVFKKRK